MWWTLLLLLNFFVLSHNNHNCLFAFLIFKIEMLLKNVYKKLLNIVRLSETIRIECYESEEHVVSSRWRYTSFFKQFNYWKKSGVAPLNIFFGVAWKCRSMKQFTINYCDKNMYLGRYVDIGNLNISPEILI